MSDSILIIGGGVAAARLVRAYREAGGDASLTMLSADTQLPYNRPPLSKGFLRGTITTEDVFVEPASTYRELDVDVRLGASVESADTEARRVVTADGTTLGYDRLVLASGSLPRRLDIPGEGLEGVRSYRTLDDALAVREAAATAGSAVVVGAGFIGMETAASLRTLGLEVTVIEPAEGLYARLANPELSQWLAHLYRERGVEVVLGDLPTAFHGLERLEHVTTRSGRTIEAQLAIVGVGVVPSTTYLEGTELALEGGSVMVDEHFRTTVPGVFAIGDLARFHDPVAGHRHLIQHWTNATYHGERLGRALAGETAPYDQVAYFFTEVFGVKLGLLGGLDAGHDQLIVRGTLEDGLIGYYLDGGRLVAALIVGQSRETQDELTQLLRNQARLERPAFLTQPDAPPALAFGPAA